MFSPISDLALADTGVQAVLGSGNDQRFYSFGEAPANPDAVNGYAVWQVISGEPSSFLAGRPNSDRHVIQVDVYAKAAAKSREITRALVEAFELEGNVTSWNGEFIDPDTKLRRISFTVEFITPR